MEYEVLYKEISSKIIDKLEVCEFIKEVLEEGGSIIYIIEPHVWTDKDNIVNRRFGIFYKKPVYN